MTASVALPATSDPSSSGATTVTSTPLRPATSSRGHAAPPAAGVPWTTVAVGRRDGRIVTDLRRGGLAPYALDDDGRTVRVALVATGALLLGGDHVRVRVRVGSGVTLEIVETSGTVAYDGRGRGARWEVDVVVESGGALVWDAQPWVVATGADVDRSTVVRLGAGAVACLRETLVLGRSGERGGRLRTATRVTGPGGPLLVEDLRVDGAVPEPGVLGAHRVVDSVVLVGCRPPHRPDAATGSGVTVLDLEEAGAVARRLGADLHRVALTDLAAAWCGLARTRHSAT